MKKKAMMAAAMVVAMSSVAHAAPARVPNVMLFQSMLFDDGGNPLPDGPLHAVFRIADGAGTVLYEEHQDLEVVRGQASALVGNGLAADGAPTGGVPIAALDPSAARYLEVEAEGQPPSAPMEVASVPYAIFAGEALRAAEGAIDGEAIADGSIAFEDLSDELIVKLASALADGGAGPGEVLVRGDLRTMYRDPQAAGLIGVVPRFAYSGANDLQGVLQDLDRAIHRREERIASVGASLAREVQDRVDAVAAEAGSRAQADAAEANARYQEDAAEASVRAQADAGEANARIQVDAAEAAVRADADAALGGRIDKLDPTVTPPPVPQHHANAWCWIASCGQQIASCGNATAASAGLTKCRVTFIQPLAGDQYAVAANPDVVISERSRNGFLASCGAADCQFDFIAIGP